ncbi:fibroblast growth factor 6-like [Phycodurus eques]|uniref:fibroblast growth factor 6-like n=1 Tax=Phycodurus eques TaxID=693459 RepID=UPI002ACEE7E6|nr:fibroblast growth factor 6-like [Phycodurus eques]
MTLPAALVLWTCVWGVVAPGGRSGANGTEVERRWETLLSRSYLGLAGGRAARPDWQSDYLRGIKRVRRLYCNVGIGFHLQVHPDGRIGGAHLEDPHSLIEISSVERGVVSLFGVKSEMFVAMSRRARLYGTRRFGDECKFRETLLPNNYNAYESFVYKGFYVALSRHGRARRGDKATTAATGTHFLPRL